MVHTDSNNAVVTYHNPLDNVADLARIFFGTSRYKRANTHAACGGSDRRQRGGSVCVCVCVCMRKRRSKMVLYIHIVCIYIYIYI